MHGASIASLLGRLFPDMAAGDYERAFDQRATAGESAWVFRVMNIYKATLDHGISGGRRGRQYHSKISEWQHGSFR
jgi:hypothetical protein